MSNIVPHLYRASTFTLALSVVIFLSGCSKPAASTGTGTSEEASGGADQAATFTGLVPYDPNNIPGIARFKNKAYILKPAVWANPNIAVCWEQGGFPAEKQIVRQAIANSWEANSMVRFYGWGICAANATGIRIAVSDTGPHTTGLGTQINGTPQGMVLNFTFKNWSPACATSEQQRQSCIYSIAVHEFGHALAFAHEQNRADTPGECTQKPQGGNGDTMLTPWDIHSVMNYCNPIYNNDGKLSALDIQALKATYH